MCAMKMTVWVLEDEVSCMAGLQEQEFGAYVVNVNLTPPASDDLRKWRSVTIRIPKTKRKGK